MIARAWLMALLLLALPASAQDVFTVGPVAVDATAQSAAAAREQARVEGQRRAFRQLLERLTPADQHRQLPRADDATSGSALQDFSVANEKSSATRYLADLTFRFRPEPVRRLLRDSNIPFAETPSKPVVALPVFTDGGNTVLWDSPNPWRDAWANRRQQGGLVPVVVPTGDLADLSAIDAEQALAGDPTSLGKITALHGGGDALVTHMRRAGSALEVTTTRHGSAGALRNATQRVAGNPGEGETDVMARAVEAVARDVEEAWKRETVLRLGGPEASLAVVVPAADLAEWVAVRDQLASIAAVRRVDIATMTRSEVRLDLKYVGDPGQLRTALAQRDLVLTEGEPYWTLRSRGGARRP